MNYNDTYIKNRHGFPVATYACSFENITEPTYVTTHYHRDFEILYVDNGVAYFQISGRRFEARSGSLILINPFEPHFIEIKSDSYAHRCVDFDLNILDLPEANKLLSEELCFANHISDATHLLHYFNLCFDAEVNKDKGWEIRAKGSLLVLFSLLDDYIGRVGSAKEQIFAREILRFLEDNFAQNITSAELAAKLSYNHSYFCRRFKKVFACSFSEYLNIYRISKAKEFLNEHSVSETALLSGFSSVSYFTTSFKRNTGMTPSEYKKNSQKG